MDNKRKPKNKGLILLGILFGAYLVVLYSKSNGYYDYKEYKKMQLTKEAMERFEEDVKNGNDVTIEDYIITKYKDYSNSISKAGAKIGQMSTSFMNKGFSKIIKVIGKFFT